MKPILSIITDYQIISSAVMVFFAWKWGDWKNWKQYYPTMLFFALGDYAYGLLAYNHPLWQFASPLFKATFSDFIISLIFFPATILIYLPHFPKTLKKQILYIILWVAIYIITEQISYILGFITHQNGWNIWWSTAFDLIMFPLLYLHHKKPLWAVLLSIIVAITVLTYFRIPLSSMK